MTKENGNGNQSEQLATEPHDRLLKHRMAFNQAAKLANAITNSNSEHVYAAMGVANDESGS